MNRKLSVVIAGLVALGGLLAYVGSGPFIAMYQIKTGLDTRDREKLNAHIDFPLLRSNLREQLNAKFAKKPGDAHEKNPMGDLMASFGAKVADGIIDSMVTPEGLAAVMEGKKSSKTESRDAQKEEKAISDLFRKFEFGFESINRVTARVKDKKKSPTFVLERQGFSWKLVNVIVPELAPQPHPK